MPKIRSQFIDSTIGNLKLLRQKILTTKDFSDVFIKEIFRQIHTVKGTAQTFGLEKSSRIAHELESVLSDVKNGQNTLTKELLVESITALENSFDENGAENSDGLIEKIKTASSAKKYLVNILPELPESVLNSLSKSETESLSAAFNNEKNTFCFEVYFALANFREKLLKFREILENRGEVIATLSAAKKDSHIGFRFLFAGKINLETIQNITEKFSPEIIFEILPITSNLSEVLTEVAAHGEKLAAQSNKKIEFEISVGEVFLSDVQTKIVFDALLHLIRNAVSHAIETSAERIEIGKKETGKIKIHFVCENENLKISVSDDGKGIDAEKIKQKAIENNLISESKDLDEQEVLDLIFHSGFSTAENLTEISGRGIGLDAVRKMVENIGGTVEVKRRKEFGTTFEIVLPPEK